MGGRGRCVLLLAGAVLNAWAGSRWLHDWVFAGLLRATNQPAGTSNCACGALAGWLIYTHARWCPVNFSETWFRHWLDNFLCVSTGGCHFVCLTYVAVALGLNQTLPFALT